MVPFKSPGMTQTLGLPDDFDGILRSQSYLLLLSLFESLLRTRASSDSRPTFVGGLIFLNFLTLLVTFIMRPQGSKAIISKRNLGATVFFDGVAWGPGASRWRDHVARFWNFLLQENFNEI